MHLSNQSLNKFIEELSSNAPTPGGGSAAALGGAMAAAHYIPDAGGIRQKHHHPVDADAYSVLSAGVRSGVAPRQVRVLFSCCAGLGSVGWNLFRLL